MALDPTYAKVLAKLARISLSEYSNQWTDDPESALARPEQLAVKALEADPSEPDAHQALGAVRLSQGKHNLTLESLYRAAVLNPNGVDNLMWLGWTSIVAGEAEKGLKFIEQAMQRNSFHPGWYHYDQAWAHFVPRQYQEAAEALERRSPKSNFTYLMLAATYAKLDRPAEAQEAMSIFREAKPEYTVKVAAETIPFKYDADLEHYLEPLRAAGLPEGRMRAHRARR